MPSKETLSTRLKGLRPAAVLKAVNNPRPDLEADPLDHLLWEVAWFAAGQEYAREMQRERVGDVLRKLRQVAADPQVARAWERCPGGVVRLLVLTVAHFPAAQDKSGVVDIYDCWHGRTGTNVDPDDVVTRLPRDPE